MRSDIRRSVAVVATATGLWALGSVAANAADLPATPDLPAVGAVKQLPAGAAKNLPTGAVKELPTGTVENLPTGAVKELPTGAVEKLPTGTVKKLPTGTVKKTVANAQKAAATARKAVGTVTESARGAAGKATGVLGGGVSAYQLPTGRLPQAGAIADGVRQFVDGAGLPGVNTGDVRKVVDGKQVTKAAELAQGVGGDVAPLARGLVTVVVTDGKATAADAVADAKGLIPAVPTAPAELADLTNAANVPAVPALPVRGR
ncbi:hypothetical protein ACFU7T_30305 [Streptomyces sp. NPDC057555]|uniref:hypothetical protein n=1 Tax=Streptomyces sp. NPDC057555 TaxID=3346166 RepID=UPI0036A53501